MSDRPKPADLDRLLSSLPGPIASLGAIVQLASRMTEDERRHYFASRKIPYPVKEED
jgi:hypothetical protein